jgi:hypothetical protein
VRTFARDGFKGFSFVRLQRNFVSLNPSVSAHSLYHVDLLFSEASYFACKGRKRRRREIRVKALNVAMKGAEEIVENRKIMLDMGSSTWPRFWLIKQPLRAANHARISPCRLDE